MFSALERWSTLTNEKNKHYGSTEASDSCPAFFKNHKAKLGATVSIRTLYGLPPLGDDCSNAVVDR